MAMAHLGSQVDGAAPEALAAPCVARLRLFGSLDYSGAEGASVPLSNRRGRAILAYAALQRDRKAPRSRLAGLLWSDRGEAQARASLRQCLVELRNALGEAPLEVSREMVCFRDDRVRVDAHELQRALDAQDPDATCRLLTEIGTDRLFDEPAVSDLHQDWLDQTREQLERRIAAGVHALLQSASDADWSLLRRLADAFLVRQPLDEAGVAAAMRADTAAGSAAAAVLRFAVLKAALQRELGVAPGDVVQEALAAAVLAREPSARTEEDGPPGFASGPPLVVVAAFPSALQTGFAHLLREEIVSGLSRFRDLTVVDDGRPEQEIRRERWLRREDAYLLTGGAHASAGGERLVCQLVRTHDFGLVWSDRGTPAPGGEASAQTVERVVARAVGAIAPSILVDLSPRLGAAPAGSYARYLLARNAAQAASTFAEARAAADALEAIIADEPALSLAYLPLARLYNTDFGFTRAGSSTSRERDRAFELTKAALALDRGHVHGYTVMGWCYLWRRRWDVARRHFDQAVELNPFHADRLMEVGFGQLFLGDLAGARARLERCLLLNPVPKDGFFMDLGLLEMLEGRHDLAEEHFDMVAAPTLFDVLYDAVNAVLAGRRSQAKSALARGRLEAIWPEATPCGVEAMAGWFADQHPFQCEATGAKLSEALGVALSGA